MLKKKKNRIFVLKPLTKSNLNQFCLFFKPTRVSVALSQSEHDLNTEAARGVALCRGCSRSGVCAVTAGWGARRQPVSPAGGEHLPALGRLLGLRGHRRDPAGRQVRPARCERPRGLAAAHRRPRGPLRLRRVSGRATGPCRLPGGRQRLGLLFGQTRPPCQASGVSVGLSGWGRGRDPCEKCPLRLTGGWVPP